MYGQYDIAYRFRIISQSFGDKYSDVITRFDQSSFYDFDLKMFVRFNDFLENNLLVVDQWSLRINLASEEIFL